MEHSPNGERQLVRLRWLVIAAAGLMLAGPVSWQKIALGVALAAAYNGAMMLAGRVPRGAEWAKRLMAFAWIFDMLMISAAVGISLRSVPSLYFLYVLVILEAGYTAPTPRKVLWTTFGSIAGNAAATFLTVPRLPGGRTAAPAGAAQRGPAGRRGDGRHGQRLQAPRGRPPAPRPQAVQPDGTRDTVHQQQGRGPAHGADAAGRRQRYGRDGRLRHADGPGHPGADHRGRLQHRRELPFP